jgi:hypothetical protein
LRGTMREFGKPCNEAGAANAAAMDQNDWIGCPFG